MRIGLDPDHYRTVSQLEAAFPDGPPSLRHCNSLQIRGPVRFGAGVTCVGDVVIDSDEELRIAAGSVLHGRTRGR